MSKREQALRIEPKNEVHFKGPYTRVVTEYFHLSNPTEKPIAFKVKTTAPKRYCVRPNNGTIAPGKSVNVAVMLQPLVGDQTPAAVLEKNKHKFMIQSVFVATEQGNADDLFKAVSPDEIMDSKFRCVFDDTTNYGGANIAAGNLAANTRPESDGESKDGAEVASKASSGSLGGDHHQEADQHQSANAVMYSSASVVSSGGIESSHMTNGSGGDEDHQSVSSNYATSRYQTATNTSGGDSTSELKRILDENRELRVKLQDLERAAKSSGAAYNRFGSSTAAAAASTNPASPSSQKASSTPSTNQASLNLLDQPLSGQVILTVLISLLIGFILGKIDLGLF